MADKKDKSTDKDKKNSGLKPDPETLHKTDPQDNMEGPISSLMQGIKEEAEEDDKEEPKIDERK